MFGDRPPSKTLLVPLPLLLVVLAAPLHKPVLADDELVCKLCWLMRWPFITMPSAPASITHGAGCAPGASARGVCRALRGVVYGDTGTGGMPPKPDSVAGTA